MNPMNNTDTLAAYQNISNVTGEMAAAARAGEWDRLTVLERHYAALVSRLAAEFAADSLQIKTRPAPQLQSGLTDWVIVSRDPDQLSNLRIRIMRRHRLLQLPSDSILMRRGSEMQLERFPLWTDDYSDLVSVIRWD